MCINEFRSIFTCEKSYYMTHLLFQKKIRGQVQKGQCVELAGVTFKGTTIDIGDQIIKK